MKEGEKNNNSKMQIRRRQSNDIQSLTVTCPRTVPDSTNSLRVKLIEVEENSGVLSLALEITILTGRRVNLLPPSLASSSRE